MALVNFKIKYGSSIRVSKEHQAKAKAKAAKKKQTLKAWLEAAIDAYDN